MESAGPVFEDWYAREHDVLVRALAVACGDRELAGEVVAEAFGRAYERWDRLGASGNPTGWVYRVAVNSLRRRWRRAALERRLLLRTQPAGTAEMAELVPELWAAIGALPARQREAIGLRYVADLSERQVADAMGIAEGTASATLAAARRRLALDLEHLEELRWT
jgi:RNA polymerase sigma-70 factor (ECF subfamily)